MRNFMQETEKIWRALTAEVFSSLEGNESANLDLNAEDSHFVRFNQGKIRQSTEVEQREITLKLNQGLKSQTLVWNLRGELATDLKLAHLMLGRARKDLEALTEDPHSPQSFGVERSHFQTESKGLRESTYLEEVLTSIKNLDFVGLLSEGPIIKATASSKGQDHWYSHYLLCIDYSLFNGKLATKGLWSSPSWSRDSWEVSLKQSEINLNLMNRPKVQLPPARYRAFLKPAAVADFLSPIQWGGFSYSQYKTGRSCLQKLADSAVTLSSQFSLYQNFKLGLAPRFNSLGELAPEVLPIIVEGKHKNFLVSSRSAQEYGVPSTGASPQEKLPCLEMTSGQLDPDKILHELDTGIYLSNLHYTNISDQIEARITGMTRFSCFWVQHGEIQGPIENLRFDCSFYELFGKNLLGITQNRELLPSTETYFKRWIEGSILPGVLVSEMDFKL